MPIFAGPFNPQALGDPAPVVEALERAGYTRDALVRLGLLGRDAVPLNKAVVHAGGEARGDLAVLIRLWLMAQPVHESRLRDALGDATGALVRAGMLREQGDSMRAVACLIPMQGFWVLRDFDPRETGQPMRPDHVPSVSQSTGLVANFTVRQRAALGLDMGCGSGYQALRLAAHCDKVIATDINERCLNFAAMMMVLNRVSNVELRMGSLFEPVEGLRFGSIASNPPFIISPGSELIFRDSGLPGDQVCERLIRRFADVLEEGGWASVLFNWHHANDATWADRPKEWVAGKGCDAWLVRFRTDDPESYARAWIVTGQGGIGEADPTKLMEWLTYYKSIGAEAMSLGAIVLRKRTGGTPANWFRVDMPKAQEEMDSASDQVRRVFDAENVLRGPKGEQGLLDVRLRVAASVRLDQVQKPSAGAASEAWVTESNRLRMSDGLELVVPVAPPVSAFVGRLDGTKQVRELARAAAKEWGVTPEQAEQLAVPVIARLMRDGFFEVV
jgi:methylase of polypeptide subunit release factors